MSSGGLAAVWPRLASLRYSRARLRQSGWALYFAGAVSVFYLSSL